MSNSTINNDDIDIIDEDYKITSEINKKILKKGNVNNHKVEFVQASEKIIKDNLENLENDFDIDISDMNDDELDKVMEKEKNQQMNDDEIINYLIQNDEVDPALKNSNNKSKNKNLNNNNNDEIKNQENNNNNNNNNNIINKLLKTNNKNKKINIKNLTYKIDHYLQKRKKKLETIQEKIEEEKKHNNFPKKKQKLRTFEEFIKDQQNHIEKVRLKIKSLQKEKDEMYDELVTLKPEINEKSKEITKKVNKNFVERLYNVSNKKDESKNTSNINTDISILANKKLSKEKENYFNNLYNDAQRYKNKINEKRNEIYNEIMQSNKSMNLSNKILYKKFKEQFQKEINNLFIQNNLIDFNNCIKLFFSLGFIKDNNINNDEKILIIEILECLNYEPINLNDLSYVNYSKNNIKINIDHLYIFCLSIIGLLNYYILMSFNDSINLTIDTKNSNNQNILIKLNEELSNRIVLHKKYGGFDSNKNYVISPLQSQHIFSHFFILFRNWKNENFNNNYNNSNLYINQPKFQPTLIASKSSKNLTNKNNGNLFTHINQSLNRKNEFEKEFNKIKKEKEKKEMENCTFKPKINKYNFKDNNVINLNTFANKLGVNSSDLIKNKNNLSQIKQKKYVHYSDNKEKECTFHPKIINNYDKIKQKYNDINKDELFDDDEKYFIKRIEAGRKKRDLENSAMNLRNYSSEGIITTSNNQRLNSNNSLNRIRLNTQNNISKNLNDMSQYNPYTDKALYDYLNKKTPKNNSKIFNTSEKKNSTPSKYNTLSNVKNISDNNNIYKRKKLLISMDVSLKNGINKKIYVLEGDKAFDLAKRFAKENNLDLKKQNKLKNLIQKEIDKYYKLNF